MFNPRPVVIRIKMLRRAASLAHRQGGILLREARTSGIIQPFARNQLIASSAVLSRGFSSQGGPKSFSATLKKLKEKKGSEAPAASTTQSAAVQEPVVEEAPKPSSGFSLFSSWGRSKPAEPAAPTPTPEAPVVEAPKAAASSSSEDVVRSSASSSSDEPVSASTASAAAEGAGEQAAQEEVKEVEPPKPLKERLADFSVSLKDTWMEMIGQKETSVLVKRVVFESKKAEESAVADAVVPEGAAADIASTRSAPDADDAFKPRSVTAVAVVREEKTAWERMNEQLEKTPGMKTVMETSRLLAKTDAGQAVGGAVNRVRDKVGDVQEYWETTQNPVVGAVASGVDMLTSEQNNALTLKELCKLDPTFTYEDFMREIGKELLPELIASYLRGDVEHMSSFVSDVAVRQVRDMTAALAQAGVQREGTLVEVDDIRLHATAPSTETRSYPLVVLLTTVQQTSALVDIKSGDVKEGSRSKLQAATYVVSFVRVYDDEKRELKWLCCGVQLGGAIDLMF